MLLLELTQAEARKPLKNNPEPNPYMQQFFKLSLWQPQHAGKIDYAKYAMIRYVDD